MQIMDFYVLVVLIINFHKMKSRVTGMPDGVFGGQQMQHCVIVVYMIIIEVHTMVLEM